MPNPIDDLLAREDVTTNGPASRSRIDAVARQFDAPLPEALVELWRRSDGLLLDGLDAHVPGPAEVVELLAIEEWGAELIERGLLPILDDHQSNYLAVAMRDPLAFRVLHLPHDDGARLLYRDFESAIAALLVAADAAVADDGDTTADLFLHDAEGDYAPDARRPEEDQDAAAALIAGPHKRDEWNHAVALLDEANVDGFAKLLETEHFVRRDVRTRMAKMSATAIRELLLKDAAAFESFATAMADALRAAGMTIGERDEQGGRCVRIGKAWWDMETFFHRRHIPDAMVRLVRWVEDYQAGRDPRARDGHFFAD